MVHPPKRNTGILKMTQITIGCKPEMKARLKELVDSPNNRYRTITDVVLECVAAHIPKLQQETREREDKWTK